MMKVKIILHLQILIVKLNASKEKGKILMEDA
jgi:hypothetical protein